MLYWVFKYVAFAPLCRLLFRPSVSGADNIPKSGAAILVSNHISAGDTFLLPSMIRRRLTFPAKVELFQWSGCSRKGPHVVPQGRRTAPDGPLRRKGQHHQHGRRDRRTPHGDLLGIYPEGTRSPDGRLYKGKTGVARIVMRAGVPVIPVGMINTELVPSRFFKIPTMRRPKIRIGKLMDFSAYAEAGNDRDVLRWITDEIMNAVMELSGQEYVDVYGTAAKTALEEGKDAPTKRRSSSRCRPSDATRSRAQSSAGCATCDGCERVSEGEERSQLLGRNDLNHQQQPAPARPPGCWREDGIGLSGSLEECVARARDRQDLPPDP